MPIHSIPMNKVIIEDGFWSPRQQLMTDVTIPFMERILQDEVPETEPSHAVSNFRIAAGEETGEFQGMVFQDSDVAKWLEAAAYSLSLKPDEELSRRVDEIAALIGRCQQDDGYLNTYFTVKEPGNRWKNLLDCHELYCAGHLLEAGAALYEAAGKDMLLQICVRFADHICDHFEKEEGIPGHQEIEIGLLRLYRITGNQRYRDMALSFLNRRGQDPHWFEKNTVKFGEYTRRGLQPADTAYNQSDVPVREQTKARGHAVRQIYMLTAMADAAAETGDAAMADACERMFRNITEKQMYVTGAVGASARLESFTVDYDLPSDRCYGETCASIAMIFFARQMLRLRTDGRYADLMELELFNAALAGMQLDGKRFFYVNPLSVDTRVSGTVPGYEHVLAQRPAWHACACCPPNLARLIASLGGYLWSEDEQTVYSHLFIGCKAQTRFGEISLESRYPWEGNVQYTINSNSAFVLAIHIPYHVKDYSLQVNGQRCNAPEHNGYCYLSRTWAPGDKVSVFFGLPVRRIYPDPRIRDCAGKTALAKGPVIYCLEGTDHSVPLSSIILPDKAEIREVQSLPGLPDDLICLKATGETELVPDHLYSSQMPQRLPCGITAIPYFAWANREKGNMLVWIRR